MLTGRIAAGPSQLLHEEILEPQFTYELHNLLPSYLQIEQALLLEYKRMGLVEAEAADEIAGLLNEITPQTITADPTANMSDIAFAIERYVEERLSRPAPAWHSDRSRNDFQACAQVMFGREQVLAVADLLFAFSESVSRLAARTVDLPMPGYTHYQAAQIITPGFYLSAMNEKILESARLLLGVFDSFNKCPLGSGAMAGLDFAWDREGIAEMLGFAEPQRHALVGVASREWSLRVAGELSTLSVLLSRFVTDLIQWGSSEYGLIDLPDQLSGISSAMPQKKNFPILERIRGRSAHISAFYNDFALGQRSTSYSNLVETSKEASAHVFTMFKTMQSTLKLFTAVLDHLTFKEEKMRDICAREYFGGFTLANLLMLAADMPYRKAQVASGRYIVEALERGLLPTQPDGDLLKEICAEQGYLVEDTEALLQQAFDVDQSLYGKRTSGSVHPQEMRELQAAQEAERAHLQAQWAARRTRIEEAVGKLQA
ncbi:MAG TPA: lyase family protein [Bacilli bacterium]|nr:lyase family protein [Bacilli bacterium]